MAAMTQNLGTDLFVTTDQYSFAPSRAEVGVPSLMFRKGELYVDTQTKTPLAVVSVGGDLVTFEDRTFPSVPGDQIVIPLFQARVRLLQSKYKRITK